jgi:hypothetical protein
LHWAPYDLTCSAVKVYAHVQPTTSGTYTLSVDANGNNLLSSASFSMTTLVSETLTSLTLTSTASHKNLTAGNRVKFTFDANNSDLAGSGIYVQLLYTPQ